jgi:hypothetical protein
MPIIFAQAIMFMFQAAVAGLSKSDASQSVVAVIFSDCII